METVVHAGLTNAAIATGLAVVVALASRWYRRPAVVHGLWLLVLLRLVVPPLWAVHLPWISRSGGHGAKIATDTAGIKSLSPTSQHTYGAIGKPIRPPLLQPRKSHPEGTISPSALTHTVLVAWEIPLGIAWLAGAVVWWLIAAVRLYRFRRLLRQLTPAPAELQARVHALADRIGLRRCPLVYLTDAPTAPLLWALYGKPRLLIPRVLWRQLTEQQRDTLLVHELAHLRRGDQWVRRLELLVMGLYWWLPVAWWARRRIQEAEEQCCDAWVVWARPENASAYAEALLAAATFVSLPRLSPPVGASGMGQFRPLQRRLIMILQSRTPRRLSWTAWATLLTCAAVVLPMAPALGQPAPDRKGEPPTRAKHPALQRAQRLPGWTHTRLSQDDALAPSQSSPAGHDTTVADAEDAVELLKAQLEEKRAELQEAEALFQQAQTQLKRVNSLGVSGGASATELDAAQTDVKVKEARVRVQRAQIKAGEVRLRQATRHLDLLRHPPQAPRPAEPVGSAVEIAPGIDSHTLRALTLQLETAILWDAVTPDWRTRRDGWVKEVTEANSVPRLAALIEELEMNVLWSAVSEGWNDRRSRWIEDCDQAKTVGALAKLLAELETYITWDAVSPNWKDVRDGWITTVEKCEKL